MEASDLVHQTLMEAYRDRERFAGWGEDELFAWLRKILHNNFLDACNRSHAARRDIGRQMLEADLTQSFVGLDELLLASQTSPSKGAMDSEQLKRLAEALEQLPEQEREKE